MIDESRLFANNTKYVHDFATLVNRDRNHPSVIIWSFCNENGCEGPRETGGPAFQNVADTYDGTRPTLANMFTYNDLLSNTVDVQGFSHRSRQHLDACHQAMPNKPILQSECCSCNTMRAEDVGCETTDDNPKTTCNQISFNARCLDKLVNASDGADYAAGTFVWTLFDYYGEPPSAGLTVSSTYGQFDLVGFPKASAFWFRSQWLLCVDGTDSSDKPFATHNQTEVYIVESWESPDTWNGTKSNTTRIIPAYTNAAYVELFVNGQSQGLPKAVIPMVQGDGGSYAEWLEVPWEKGEIVAVERSSPLSKTVADNHGCVGSCAQTKRRTSGKPASIQLSLDCPSKSTGTGESLLLDGQDVALVRASILDESGNVVHMATNNVTFRVLSGPGRIQGTGNGDPKSYEPNNALWHTAYHGLVRAVIRVTSIAGLSSKEKELIQMIDIGPSSFLYDGSSSTTNTMMMMISWDEMDDIVVEATSPGLESVQIQIPTSTDATTSSVLAVAATTAGQPVNFFNDPISLPPSLRDNTAAKETNYDGRGRVGEKEAGVLVEAT